MTITALRTVSIRKPGCLSYSWKDSSNENYESWKARPRAHGHSCLVSTCKRVALAIGLQSKIVRRSRPMKTMRFRRPRALSSVLATLGHYSQGPRPSKSRIFHGLAV